MKYIKLFLLLAVAVVGLSACSDDDGKVNNVSTTTVSLPSDTIKIKEGYGLYRIPVTVTGVRNGDVKVTVSVTGTGTNPAEADVNYYLTSNTSVISKDSVSSEGFIEFETIDDDDINADREFTVTITQAEGATIGNASVVVVLRDNDSEFYEKLQGTWTMNVNGYWDGAMSWNVTISGASDADDPDYNNTLYLSGAEGYSWVVLKLSYHYDITTNEGYVAFDDLGSYYAAEGVGFTSGTYDIVPLSYNGGLSYTAITGHWSDDFKTITFEADPYLALITSQNGELRSYWDMFNNITLSK